MPRGDYMRRDCYLIHEWFSSDLRLSGYDRDVFGIIYGYSIKGCDCKLSINGLSQLTGASERTMQRSLNELMDRNLIFKRTDKDCVIYNSYFANFEEIERLRGI